MYNCLCDLNHIIKQIQRTVPSISLNWLSIGREFHSTHCYTTVFVIYCCIKQSTSKIQSVSYVMHMHATLYENTTIWHCTPAQNPLIIGIDVILQPIIKFCFWFVIFRPSPSQQQDLQQLLNKYSDLFVTTEGQLGRTNMAKHSITTSEEPVRQPMDLYSLA